VLFRSDLVKLENDLTILLNKSKARNKFVCIPIEEIEGWFLADLEGIKEVFKLKRIPKINGNPENIGSPKEKLENLIMQCSNKSKIYLNTKHNDLLSAKLDLDKISKSCNSFKKLEIFINKFNY
jgi:hypothetical protein